MNSASLYSIIAPLNDDSSKPHPALILLHGRGTDENDLLGLTPYLDPRFLIASVRAPYKYPYGGYTWFDLDDDGTIRSDQLLQSHNAFFKWLDEFQRTHAVDDERIFLFGFSMGAMMSLAVSLTNPLRFKGIVAHSGFLPDINQMPYQWDNLGELSYYLAHGIYDPIVPIDLGRKTQQRFKAANANVLYREYPIQHTISEESVNDVSEWLQQRI